MTMIRCFIAIFLLFVSAANAATPFKLFVNGSAGGGGGGACPQGVSGDGCTAGQTDPAGNSILGPPTANANSVQHSNFFTSYAGPSEPHRPPWNVAGVDYPVGVGSSTYSGSLTAAVNGSGQAAAGLASQGCKGPGDAGGSAGQFNCGTNQGGAGLTINGYDFTNSGNCLSLYVSNQTGTVTITNSKFVVNNSTSPYCGAQGVVVDIDGSNTGASNASYNIIDGGSSTGTSNNPTYLLQTLNSGNQTVEYNVIIGMVVRGWSPNNCATCSYFYNYMEGVYGTGSSHGDMTFPNPSSGPMRQDYNTALSPAGMPALAGASCVFCIDNGGTGATYTGVSDVSHNTMVANPLTGGAASFGPALITATHANTYTNGVTVNTNYADCGQSGTPTLYIAFNTSGSGTVSGSGNVSMVTGNTLSALVNNWTTNYSCP